MNLNSYKTMGTIYDIPDTQFTAKGFPKRELFVEIPTSTSGSQKSVVIKFTVLGDEAGSLDFYEVGQFVEILFKLDSFEWKKPETGEKIHLQSLKIVDIHKRDNPFETGEKVADLPDDLSPDPVAELATKVKDWTNIEKGNTLFDKDGNMTDDDLPF